MPYSAFDLEVKGLDQATGEFTGFASVYGNVDYANEVVDPGAFTKTLQEKGKERPLLWAHAPGDPVGLCQLQDTPTGLAIKGTLCLDIQRAKDVYALLKTGVVKGLSVGYQTIRSTPIGGVVHLQELKLHEISLVTLPCNELATVTSVKAAQTNEIRRALESLRTGVLSAFEKEK